ncbi:unnamed protein product [Blepharisma stoltei]|uniref:Uncharacterized protein n=1 Tax=Blepharisma stoltei TaxID=1481888 RepID=A0AAU9JCR6_9CILI|nr:unnamed protein product [Blepharisma stoltei]
MILAYVLIIACSAEYIALNSTNHSYPYRNTSPKDWLILYTNNPSGKIEQEFLNASQSEITQKLTFSLFNCQEHLETCERLKITKLPNATYVSRGLVKEFNWDLTYDDFLEFGQKISMPQILPVSSTEHLRRFRKFKSAFMLWTFPEFLSGVRKPQDIEFEQLAREMHHTHTYFGKSQAEGLFQHARVEWTELPAVKQHGIDDAYDYNITNFDRDSLRDFVEKYKYGMVFNFTRSIEKEVMPWLKGKLFALAAIDLNNQTQTGRYVGHMRALAWGLRKAKDFRFQFSYLDINIFPDIAEKFKAYEHPQLILVDYRRANSTAYYFGDFPVENETKLHKLLNDTWDYKTSANYTTPLPKKCHSCGGIPFGGYLVIASLLFVVGLIIYIIRTGAKQKQD